MDKKQSYIYSLKTYVEYNLFGDHISDFSEYGDKRYDIKESGVQYRNINYWESVGVLDDCRQVAGQGWRQFSDIDLAFIAIISHLRGIGMSLENIKNVKESLYSSWNVIDIETDTNNVELTEKYVRFDLEERAEDSQVSLLEFAFLRVVCTGRCTANGYSITNVGNHSNINSKDNEDTYLIIDNNGMSTIMTDCDLDINKTERILPYSYYCVNLNALFGEYFGDKFKFIVEKAKPAQSQLNAALKSLYNDKVMSVSIDKKAGIIEKKIKLSPEDVDMENMPDYSKIETKKYGGKVSSVTLTITDKFNAKK